MGGCRVHLDGPSHGIRTGLSLLRHRTTRTREEWGEPRVWTKVVPTRSGGRRQCGWTSPVTHRDTSKDSVRRSERWSPVGTRNSRPGPWRVRQETVSSMPPDEDPSDSYHPSSLPPDALICPLQ